MNLRTAILAATAALTLTLTGCATQMPGTGQAMDSAVASVQQAAEDAAEPDTFTLVGGLILTDIVTARTGCFPASTSGYKDIGWGTTVVVTDDTGRTIGIGSLDFGEAGAPLGFGNDTCVFGFQIDDVPADSKFYAVEVSHRGAVTFTNVEAHDYAGVTLGD